MVGEERVAGLLAALQGARAEEDMGVGRGLQDLGDGGAADSAICAGYEDAS